MLNLLQVQRMMLKLFLRECLDYNLFWELLWTWYIRHFISMTLFSFENLLFCCDLLWSLNECRQWHSTMISVTLGWLVILFFFSLKRLVTRISRSEELTAMIRRMLLLLHGKLSYDDKLTWLHGELNSSLLLYDSFTVFADTINLSLSLFFFLTGCVGASTSVVFCVDRADEYRDSWV